MRSVIMNRTHAVCGMDFVLPAIKPSTLAENQNAYGTTRQHQAWSSKARHRSTD